MVLWPDLAPNLGSAAGDRTRTHENTTYATAARWSIVRRYANYAGGLHAPRRQAERQTWAGAELARSATIL
jgi:hypothetical protein